jgi:hypothetical protein
MSQASPLEGPQRRLSADEVEQETRRLLALCAEKGVEAVLAEARASPELLEALTDACFRSGLTAAGQYLHYLANPYD